MWEGRSRCGRGSLETFSGKAQFLRYTIHISLKPAYDIWFSESSIFPEVKFSFPDTYSQKIINWRVPLSAFYLVLPHFQTPLPRQLSISMLWKFSNERQGHDAWYWTMIMLTRSIVYSFPAFLRVLFLEFKALARILFLADLAFLSLNLREGFKCFQNGKALAAPVQICEAGPLSLDSHPLGPGGIGPGLINLKGQSAFVRKAWKEGLVKLQANLMWSCLN